MSSYKSEDIREYFNISHETVRRYAIDFKDFLSDGANPGEGKHRTYTDSDLRVFAVIISMKNSNHSDDDIKATLRAGQGGDLESVLDDTSLTLTPSFEVKLARQEISNLRDQLQAAIDDAQVWRDKANKLEGQLELLRQQVAQPIEQSEAGELNKEIARLNRELGKLEALLEMAQNKKSE